MAQAFTKGTSILDFQQVKFLVCAGQNVILLTCLACPE